jgi:hypothetical protein
MARHPIELGHQHTDRSGPRRKINTEQSLGRQREAELVVEGCQVIHAGDVGRSLQERQGLTGLFHSRVQIADDRLDPPHDLALQLQLQSQNPMSGGMLGSHVEDGGFLFVLFFVVEPVVGDERPALFGHLLG